VVIGEPIRFNHRSDEWKARVRTRRAVRYDITFDEARDRWYLDASCYPGDATRRHLRLRRGLSLTS
jgi:hypothetical protein